MAHMQHGHHKVSFVEDAEMPDDQNWLIVEVDDEVHCILRRSNICPRVLEDAWAGYRRLTRRRA